jgi:hypothetical protein
LSHKQKIVIARAVSDSSPYAGGLRQVADPTKTPCYPCIPQPPLIHVVGVPRICSEKFQQNTKMSALATHQILQSIFFSPQRVSRSILRTGEEASTTSSPALRQSQRRGQEIVNMDPTLFFFHVLD